MSRWACPLIRPRPGTKLEEEDWVGHAWSTRVGDTRCDCGKETCHIFVTQFALSVIPFTYSVHWTLRLMVMKRLVRMDWWCIITQDIHCRYTCHGIYILKGRAICEYQVLCFFFSEQNYSFYRLLYSKGHCFIFRFNFMYLYEKQICSMLSNIYFIYHVGHICLCIPNFAYLSQFISHSLA